MGVGAAVVVEAQGVEGVSGALQWLSAALSGGNRSADDA